MPVIQKPRHEPGHKEERDQLAAGVAALEKRGGKAQFGTCGEQGGVCASGPTRVARPRVYGDAAKAETYRVIKGY